MSPPFLDHVCISKLLAKLEVTQTQSFKSSVFQAIQLEAFTFLTSMDVCK